MNGHRNSISCVVPVFNGERYLGEALDSILEQIYLPYEVIVVDDGSTDGTRRTAGRYRNRVRYVYQQNAGPAAARNRGIREAHGEFIAFLDADDTWHLEKLARQIARFTARPDLDFCMTHMQNVWEAEVQAEQVALQDTGIDKSQPGTSQTFLVRRATFDRVGLFDPTLWHRDAAEWILRAEKIGAVGELLPDALVYRRIHSDNRSRQRGTAEQNDLFAILKNTLREWRSKESVAGDG